MLGELRDIHAVVAGALSATAIPSVHAQGSDTIKVGVIGCGGRGTGAAENCAESAPGVKIFAMGDLFPDHPAAARRQARRSMRRFRSQGVMESRLSTLRRESAPDPERTGVGWARAPNHPVAQRPHPLID